MTEFYQIRRVARILDCTRKNVYYLIRSGKLRAMRLGPRKTRVERASLEQYVKEKMREFEAEKGLDILNEIKKD